MKIRTTINVQGAAIGAVLGALLALLTFWLFGGLERSDFKFALGLVAGNLACLWSAYLNRDRETDSA